MTDKSVEETAWLIEAEGPKFLIGAADACHFAWSTSTVHAVRFSRQVDALVVLEVLRELNKGHRLLGSLESARATEHMWCGVKESK